MAAAALVAALAIYWPALESYLVTDDFQWVQGGLRFDPAQLIDLSNRTHFYRPVVELYFAGMQAAAPCSAMALHAASIVIHVLNAVLVAALASKAIRGTTVAALAGVLFAVQSAPAEAVAWPSAVSALFCATFGLLMLLVDLGARRNTPVAVGGVAAAFAGALASHESGAMFLPAAVLLRIGRGERQPFARWLREYAAPLLVLGGYLALTVWINSRNYVVTEGHYRLGAHVVNNLFAYLVSLYAGHKAAAEYALAGGVCLALLWKGSPKARALCAWMLLAMVPVLPFSWGTASRYAYIPSIPFACLLALGLVWLRNAAASRLAFGRPGAVPAALLVALALFLSVRFAIFARKGAKTFAAGASTYEVAAEAMRDGASGGSITIARSEIVSVDPLYVLPLARTAVCNPEAEIRIQIP